MTRKDLMKLWFKNVNIEKAKKGDEKELNKFRKNLSIYYVFIQKEKPEIREKLLRGIKAGALQLIANIPVITPSITAFLQTVTSDDLGTMLSSKIDDLGATLGSKIDNLSIMMAEMIELQKKTLKLLEDINKTLSSLKK